MDVSFDVQRKPAGQWLPTLPRQPGRHVYPGAAHTRPLAMSPQSESRVHVVHLPPAQCPERHALGSAHASPSGMPQRRSAAKHGPKRHWSVVEHAAARFRPHRLSPTSHTPETHARKPTTTVQGPGGDGMGEPLASFAVQVYPAAGQYCVDAQSVSVAHVAPHAPVVRLQIGRVGRLVQSPLPVHRRQAPPTSQ
jgi:hypothetical protein